MGTAAATAVQEIRAEEQLAKLGVYTPKGKNKILKKLHAIMADIKSVPKDGYNSFQKYNYVTDESVKTIVRDALVKYGVFFHVESVHPQNYGSTVDPNEKNHTIGINMYYTFYDVDSDEQLSGSIFTQGSDALDKGPLKAMTAAIKYVLMDEFLIPTGDDPENEKEKQVAQMFNAPAVAAPMRAVTIPVSVGGANGVKVCSDCGNAMKLRKGSRGEFWGCTGYPKCSKTAPLEESAPPLSAMDEPPIKDDLPF